MARKPITDPKRAVAYLRTSTNRQDLSPEAQRAAINGWATREGTEIRGWFEDRDVSGGDGIDNCPQLLAALDGLKLHAAGVFVVAKRDRMARDPMKAGLFHSLVERQGAVVVSAAGEGNGSDPTDVLLRGIIDLFAAHERLVIKQRTRVALAVKSSRGERVGSVPYGFRLDETGPRNVRDLAIRLVPDESEQQTIALVRELRANGSTVKGILASLEARGIPTRKGTPWQYTSIVRILSG